MIMYGEEETVVAYFNIITVDGGILTGKLRDTG